MNSLLLMPLTKPTVWTCKDALLVELQPYLEKCIRELPAEPVVSFDVFSMFRPDNPSGFVRLETDGRGEPLTYTQAGQLRYLNQNPLVVGPWRNQAVWAYIANISSHMPIVLYWH